MGDPAIMQITEESNKKQEQEEGGDKELEIKKSTHSASKQHPRSNADYDNKYQGKKKY
jgi:hypothetical protein